MSNTSNTSDMSNTSHTQKSRNSPRGEKESGKREKDTADHRSSPMEVLRRASTQFAELTGMAPESVTSFEQTEDGWTLEIEVLELARVPDTMSLIASYQVELDPDGELTGYRRVRRYERGRADPRRQGGR
jgi:Gas vesicle synthesis protein GvpO